MKIASLLVAFVLVAAAGQTRDFTILDYYQRKCAEGDAAACKRFEESKTAVAKLEVLEQHAVDFGAQVKREELEENNKPRLDLAYPLVIHDYFSAPENRGAPEAAPDAATLSDCGDHYHNFWVNRKLWWPTDDQGRPNWTDIYFYIIDHYYGVCLKRFGPGGAP
jgi:hypothetical protein